MTLFAEKAAMLVIGNELLSGKIQEQNLVELGRLLRVLGVRLVRVCLVPDEVDVIADAIRELRRLADVVFTSGGVGPTHDDVTIEAVARAFDVEAAVDPGLSALLREVYGERCTDAHLRMALVPVGAKLVSTKDAKWPTPLMGNVFVLPGVPEIFRMRLDTIREHVRGPRAFVSKAVFLKLDEPELTPTLDAVVAAHPLVEIGSYPKWFDTSYKTKVTFDGRDEPLVLAAFSDFVARVRPSDVARVE